MGFQNSVGHFIFLQFHFFGIFISVLHRQAHLCQKRSVYLFLLFVLSFKCTFCLFRTVRLDIGDCQVMVLFEKLNIAGLV